jgi:GT2 family glycosyltransferase
MRLSVIVTIVDGGETLERCLTALANQEAAPSFDVLVPWDDTSPV